MGKSTEERKEEPWGPQQPFLGYGYEQSKSQYDAGGPDPYGGNRQAGFNPLQESAFNMTQNRAQMGSPVNAAAEGHSQNVLEGGFLNSNPYLDATYEKASRAMMPGINATFGGAGRTGSNAHASALGTGLADLATGIYGENYQAERGRQDTMVGRAGDVAGQAYKDFDQLKGVGDQVQQQSQNILQGDKNYWDEQQQQPQNALNQYIAQIEGNVGTDSTTKSNNPLATILGGASVANDLLPDDWWKKFKGMF